MANRDCGSQLEVEMAGSSLDSTQIDKSPEGKVDLGCPGGKAWISRIDYSTKWSSLFYADFVITKSVFLSDKFMNKTF